MCPKILKPYVPEHIVYKNRGKEICHISCGLRSKLKTQTDRNVYQFNKGIYYIGKYSMYRSQSRHVYSEVESCPEHRNKIAF